MKKLYLPLIYTIIIAASSPSSITQIINRESLTQEEFETCLNFDLSKYNIFNVPNLGSFYINDNSTSLVKHTLKKGLIWEPKISNLIRLFAKPGSLAIDIGAHIGCHTVTMSECVGPLGQVLAFEPALNVFCELAVNIALNKCSNCTLYKYALSNHTGEGIFNVFNHGEELSSLRRTMLDNKTTKPYWSQESVKIIRLDELNLNNVSLIKIDVEGGQDNVIKGALQTIRHNKPIIIFEARDPVYYSQEFLGTEGFPTNKLLESEGYMILWIENSDWIALPANMFKNMFA